MARLTLRYAEDPTTGLPRLDSPEGHLSAADLDVLCREIERSYERLASGPDGQLLTLDSLDDSRLPQHYRVNVTERGKRCPTLQLEAADPVESDNVLPDEDEPSSEPLPERWQGRFLTEVAEWLSSMPGNGADRSSLDFVLADLRAVLRRDPKQFLLLLFAGYLHVGDVLTMRHGDLSENPYLRAADELVRHASDSFPEGVFDPLLSDSLHSADPSPVTSAEETGGWWQGFFSLS